MAPSKALAELALQKRFLQAESEAQRLVLASELHRAFAPVRWTEGAKACLRPLLFVGAPLAGLWFTRRSKGVTRWATLGLGAMRLAHTLRRLILRRKPH